MISKGLRIINLGRKSNKRISSALTPETHRGKIETKSSSKSVMSAMTLRSGMKKSSSTTNPNKGTGKSNIKGRNGFGMSSRAGVVGEYVVVEETETGVRRGRHRKGKRACGVEVRIYREVMKEEHEEKEVVLESVEDARAKGGSGDGKGKEKGNGESSEVDWNDDDVHGKAEVQIGDGETSEMDWNDEDVGAKVEVEISDFKVPEMITGERLGSEGVLLVEDSEPRVVSVTAQRTLEENTGTQGLTHKKSASTFNRFLGLPPEIRFMIYEYLLVVGKVFPHPKPRHDVRYSGWQEYEKPLKQLFRVCRRVKEECEKMYWAKNHFVMPYGNKLTWIGYPPFEGIRSKQGKHHPHKDIRSMSVAFDMRDDNGNDESENGGRWMVRYLVRRYHDTYYGDGAFDRLSSPERQVVIHDVQLKRLTDITWGDYAGSMHDFDLDFLQIDFSRCYCPIGCHRMAVEATKILFHFYPGRPKEIEILGAISLWEQNKISEVILKAEEPWNPGLVFTKIKWSDYLDDFEYDPQEDIGDIDLP